MHSPALFFTIRNSEILKPSISEFESNFSAEKTDSISPLYCALFPLIHPPSKKKKKIKEYVTECEEPYFLYLGPLMLILKLLLT